MAVLPWPAGQCPYITPDQLSQWPTGVSWNTLPPNSDATASQRFAVQSMICLEASKYADQIVNQPLRSVETTEELSGPNYRVTVQFSSRNGRIIASRWPVTSVSSVQVSSNSAWPRQWTSLPAGTFEPEYPVNGLGGVGHPSTGAGGQGILFAPGYVCGGPGWPGGALSGRNAFRVLFTYTAGWPHTCLTQAAVTGDGTIHVDDCTGWLLTGTGGQPVGADGLIYDAMGGGQEAVTATAASVTTGPGVLTLASPLAYDHAPGIVVSAQQQPVIWASALLAGQAALARGATATTIQTTGGRQQVTGGGLEKQARILLASYRRTI